MVCLVLMVGYLWFLFGCMIDASCFAVGCWFLLGLVYVGCDLFGLGLGFWLWISVRGFWVFCLA